MVEWVLPSGDAHETMSFAILTANLPTLVPPNFCTSHFVSGSMLFWCKFGGVRTPEDEESEDEREEVGDPEGVEISDIPAIVYAGGTTTGIQ